MPIPARCHYLDSNVPEDFYGEAHIAIENGVPTLQLGKAPNVTVGANHSRCKAVPGVGIKVTEDGVGIAEKEVITRFCRGWHDECLMAQNENERRGIISFC